ncbi:MAG: phenylacetate--CoA ligase family protein [Dehalococcoidia bacterium]|nr:phenylacetate--CoA ligase family protein [Dehalococcoidia bacterium]
MVRSFVYPKAAGQRYWNEYLQTMPREKLDELHLKRIQRLIKFAYDNSAMYRRLYDKAGLKPEDVRTWDDFHHKVPFTDKPDYMADQELSFFAGEALPPEYRQYYFQTTGTTGQPLREHFTSFDTVRMADAFCYGYWDNGVRPGDSFYFAFNWGTWIGLWSVYWGCLRMNCTVYSGGGLSTEERIKAIISLKPKVVVGTPTYLLHMITLARAMGLDLRESGVRVLSGGGEPGFNVGATRQALLAGWGAEKAVDFVGIGELNIVHPECGANPGGVHAAEDVFHSFSVDPESGDVTPDGQVGENVITTYSHSSQVFIKYRTHDLVERHEHADHGCGWTWAYYPGTVLGRADFMVIIRGVNVYPTAVENLLGQVEGVTHYYELHITREEGMDRMLVKVEAREDIPSDQYADLTEKVSRMYRDVLGVRLEAEVLAPNTLPRYELKSKKIFDHRPPEVRRKLER